MRKKDYPGEGYGLGRKLSDVHEEIISSYHCAHIAHQGPEHFNNKKLSNFCDALY